MFPSHQIAPLFLKQNLTLSKILQKCNFQCINFNLCFKDSIILLVTLDIFQCFHDPIKISLHCVITFFSTLLSLKV